MTTLFLLSIEDGAGALRIHSIEIDVVAQLRKRPLPVSECLLISYLFSPF